jgi:hypothetical protein
MRSASLPLPAREPRAAVSWPLWVGVAAVTSTGFGVEWDIAWHRSIGRDSFWSPPHIAIYLGGVLAGLASAILILGTTFGRARDGDESASAGVRIWGFRGPLGAFIAAWGGLAMIASAPFDDWWHNAYGLDVRILSPPHTLLALGIFGIALGALLMIAGVRNRAPSSRLPRALFIYLSGMTVALVMTFQLEYTNASALHSGTPYRVLSIAMPFLLAALGRASGERFGATAIAGVYTIVWLLLLWLFPLVPAVPKLGPVYFQVTHLVPPGFPVLLIVPALALDLVGERLEGRALPWRALVLGVLFFALLLAAEWPMARLLVSAAADNWFFGSHYHDYNADPSWAEFHHTFYRMEVTRAQALVQLALGLAIAPVSVGLGLAWGTSLRKLRR